MKVISEIRDVGTKTEPEQKKRIYPYIGILCFTSLVVLFVEPRTGIVIIPNEHNGLGAYDNTWIEDNFELLDADKEVILSNAE